MDFVEVKTSELTGAALDWAVALADGWEPDRLRDGQLRIKDGNNFRYAVAGCSPRVNPEYRYSPSTIWGQCGPLILKYQPALIPEAHDGAEGTEYSEKWYANIYYNGGDEYTTEPCDSPLIAACRAIVATMFGDTAIIPSELVQ